MKHETLAASAAADPTTQTPSPPRSYAVPARRTVVARIVDVATLPRLAVASWLAWLVLALALLGTPRDSNIGLTQIAESWGAIERVALWRHTFRWLLPSYELAPGLIAYGIRFAFIAAYVIQALAFLRVLRSPSPSFWRWLIGPIGAHVVMMLMAPSNADVFFYEMSGDLAAHGINPYLHELIQFPDNPLIAYNHWIDIGTVYGPFWTDINAAIMAVIGPDPVVATFAYKIVLGLVALSLAALVYWLARRITGNQSLAVAAGVLVAWQPNMIFESSGQMHNDPLVMLIATAGMALAIVGGIGALRGGLVLLAASFATKFITLPLVGIAALLRLAKPEHGERDLRRIARSWALDAVAIVAVVLAGFLPYWHGYQTIHEMLAEPSRLFAHPVWRVGEAILQSTSPEWAVRLYHRVLRVTMAAVTLGVFTYVTWHMIRVLWRRASSGVLTIMRGGEERGIPWWTHPLLVAWTIILVTLSMLPVNAHPWYWTWAVTPVALLVTMELRDVAPDARQAALPRWLKWYLIATAVMTLMYHTRIARY